MTVAGVFMPWWGPEPSWARQLIERSMQIQSLDAILVGDAAEFCPDLDVARIPCTMDEFEARASAASGIKIRKRDPLYMRAQALCELRPLMADMYPDCLKGYGWWGWGDWDCVWGDWDSYLTPDRLEQYDAISSSSYTINGPLQLMRKELSRLYLKRPDMLKYPNADYHLDEAGMQQIVAAEIEVGRIRCLYPQDLDSHDWQEDWPGVSLQGGKLYRVDRGGRVGAELLNWHFQHTNRWPEELCPIGL